MLFGACLHPIVSEGYAIIGVHAVTAPLVILRVLHGVAYCCGEVGRCRLTPD